MSDNIIQLNEDLIKHDLKDDRVNLLSVGESQRVPATDLSRLVFLKFTSFWCPLSNVT